MVTSAEAGAFPPDLPVGTVHYSAEHVPEVMPAALLDRLEVVRIFDYGLWGRAARSRLAPVARFRLSRAVAAINRSPGHSPAADALAAAG